MSARRYFPDEEPEDEHPWLPYAGCGFCGVVGHEQHECPVRPVTP